MEIIRRHFPRTLLETYAVQEPCWASCLPQILRSLGFTAAVLKDPGTAWGGYSAGFDAELVNWVGSDGTSIPTVPRYACEDLKKVYETESGNPTPEFARKCVEHGIHHPGWNLSSGPRLGRETQSSGGFHPQCHVAGIFSSDRRSSVKGVEIRHRRYPHDASLGREDAATCGAAGAVGGESHPHRRKDGRHRVDGKTERVAGSGSRCRLGQSALGQGHDPWITATTRTGRQAWAFQVAAGTMQTEETATSIIDEASKVLAAANSVSPSQNAEAQWIRVVNTLGTDRDELAEISFATDRGTRSIECWMPRAMRFLARSLPPEGTLPGSCGRISTGERAQGGSLLQANQ